MTSSSSPSSSAEWSGIAAWYDALLSGGSGPHEHATAVTLRLAGDISGAAVLDLACGQASHPGRWHRPVPHRSPASTRRRR